MMTKRCGYVTIVGKPNVGKSTLLNNIAQKKISIVTHKAQTTRKNVKLIRNIGDNQIIFTDTPGVETSVKSNLGKHLNKTSYMSTFDADIIIFMTSYNKWNKNDEVVLKNIKESGLPTILVINKIDRLKKRDDVLPVINMIRKKHDFIEIIPMSALREQEISKFLTIITDHLPQQAPLIENESLYQPTDSFIITERVREHILKNVHQEIPYETTVQVEKIEDEETIKKVHVVIWVNTDGQKRILIGKKGSVLKIIGTNTRLDLEKYFEKKIHIKLWVKIKNDWWITKTLLKELKFNL